MDSTDQTFDGTPVEIKDQEGKGEAFAAPPSTPLTIADPASTIHHGTLEQADAPTAKKTPAPFNYATLDEDTAAGAREAAKNIRRSLKRLKEAVREGLRLGEVLFAWKKTIGHGFYSWIWTEFGMEEHTARRWIRVFERFADDPELAERLALGVLYILSQRPALPGAVETIKADVEAGKRVTQVDAHRAVAAAQSKSDTVSGPRPKPVAARASTKPESNSTVQQAGLDEPNSHRKAGPPSSPAPLHFTSVALPTSTSASRPMADLTWTERGEQAAEHIRKIVNTYAPDDWLGLAAKLGHPEAVRAFARAMARPAECAAVIFVMPSEISASEGGL